MDSGGVKTRPPRTMFAKVWERHVVMAHRSGPSLLYIDRAIVHEGSFHAFAEIRRRGLAICRPAQMFGTPDHYVPTNGRRAEDAATAGVMPKMRCPTG